MQRVEVCTSNKLLHAVARLRMHFPCVFSQHDTEVQSQTFVSFTFTGLLNQCLFVGHRFAAWTCSYRRNHSLIRFSRSDFRCHETRTFYNKFCVRRQKFLGPSPVWFLDWSWKFLRPVPSWSLENDSVAMYIECKVKQMAAGKVETGKKRGAQRHTEQKTRNFDRKKLQEGNWERMCSHGLNSKRWKDKFIDGQAMNLYRRCRGIHPVIPSLETRCRQAPAPLPLERTILAIEQEVRRLSEPIWTFERREKSFDHFGTRNPDHAACSLGDIPTGMKDGEHGLKGTWNNKRRGWLSK